MPRRSVGQVSAVLLAIAFSTLLLSHSPVQATEPGSLRITSVEATVFFPKVQPGQPLRQIVRVGLENAGEPCEAQAKITLAGQAPYVESLGQVAAQASVQEIHVPDVAQPTEVTVELRIANRPEPVARHQFVLQPAKKWRVFCVSYSHHDLGYGDYPHRLRTTIRHANIERPLRFCRETDGWDEESKFRFVIETSEPIPSFLSSHSDADAAELAQRIREGRIQLAGLHNTANTEQLSQESLTRLFYLSNRHTRDLLDVPASKTAQVDDVIGLTWPLATLCQEAGLPYFFHGHNGCATCLLPAAKEPLFFWQGPDGHSRVLVRSTDYGGYAGDSLADGSEKHVETAIRKFSGPNWPYDLILLQEGTDFQLVTLDVAQKIRAWNAKWAYPRLVCATMDMFFAAMTDQADPTQIKTFAKDGNNEWADQDANDAWLLGQARRVGESLPTTETLATIAQAVAGGGYPWTDIYQGYHRLLAYHEHTNAIDNVEADPERMRRYETELEENREMVAEAKEFDARARRGAWDRLLPLISTEGDKTVVVFNPLTSVRTDVVPLDTAGLPKSYQLIDPTTNQAIPHQTLPDGQTVFVASEVPSLGYKSYRIVSGGAASPASADPDRAGDLVLENRFYRLSLDPKTGTIASLRDKQLDVELVDATSPHKFNEYLYERYETSDPKDPPRQYRVESAQVTIVRGPVADVATVSAAPFGVESLQQRVTLYHQLKRIEFDLDLVKSPSGRDCRMKHPDPRNRESLYLALPLAIPEFQFHHELPGAVVEPIRDQFTGSCTAFYAIRHYADVSNTRYGATVASVDASLVEYGRPRGCLTVDPHPNQGEFEKVMEYPANSRIYLYLLNNMFNTNVRWDQAGPIHFGYSLSSHEGDWRTGRAGGFGEAVHQPLFSEIISQKQQGRLPASLSFVTIDQPNVACTTIKPAEANGAGIIVRVAERQGVATEATVKLPFLGPISSVTETDLVENDRQALPLEKESQIRLSLPPFGVKTIRVRCQPRTGTSPVRELAAKGVSDMEIALTWQVDPAVAKELSHFHVYRGATADFRPSLRNLVQRPVSTTCVDRPQLNYGGWINNRLEPETAYYYRVTAVDRWNNESPVTGPVQATTLKTREKDMVPLPVECLRAVFVSPLTPYRSVNLLFRTNCESDIAKYEIYRSTQSGFVPDAKNRVAEVAADTIIPGSTVYGHTPVDYQVRDFDHAMYWDTQVEPGGVYFYRVGAVDRAGQRGPVSPEASVRVAPATGDK